MTDTASDLRERSGQFRKRTTARSLTRSGECGAVQDFATTARGERFAHPRSGVYRDETKRKPKMHLRFGSGVGSGFKISLCWRQLLLITIVCCVVRSASTAVCQ